MGSHGGAETRRGLRGLVGGVVLALLFTGRAHAQSSAVTYLPSAEVAAAFAKGAPLIEVQDYKIHASRREAAGMSEVHVRDTDIIYVLEGEATFVTGGTVVEGRTVAKDEIRGSSIAGGETRRLVKGDVVVVPNGTAHWFKDVRGPFLYYVIKVTAAAPAMGSSSPDEPVDEGGQ